MTYQECDKLLRKYHCYIVRNESNKSYDTSHGLITITYKPSINAKNRLTDFFTTNLYTADIAYISTSAPYNFSIGSYDDKLKIPFKVVKLIYQLASTPINKRRVDQNKQALKSVNNLKQVVKNANRKNKKVSKSYLSRWIKSTVSNLKHNEADLPKALSSKNIAELSSVSSASNSMAKTISLSSSDKSK